MQHLVIVPTYNESENIKNLIKQLVNAELDCLFIDDGSPDNTAGLISKSKFYNSKVFLINRESKKGYATACLEGFMYGLDKGYDYIIQMDADFSHSISDLEKMIPFSKNYDLVIGSRYTKGGKTLGWGLFRTNLSKYANIFARIMTRSKIKDLTSGFRIYKSTTLKQLNLLDISSEGYGFLVEVLDKVLRSNSLIKEVPITFNDRKFGESKMSYRVILDGIKTTSKIGFRNFKLLQ